MSLRAEGFWSLQQPVVPRKRGARLLFAGLAPAPGEDGRPHGDLSDEAVLRSEFSSVRTDIGSRATAILPVLEAGLSRYTRSAFDAARAFVAVLGRD